MQNKFSSVRLFLIGLCSMGRQPPIVRDMGKFHVRIGKYDPRNGRLYGLRTGMLPQHLCSGKQLPQMPQHR